MPFSADAIANEFIDLARDSGDPVSPMKLQKLRDRLQEVEHEVASLESEIQQHEAALADFKSVEETLRLNELLTTRRAQLETHVAEWETLSAELDVN